MESNIEQLTTMINEQERILQNNKKLKELLMEQAEDKYKTGIDIKQLSREQLETLATIIFDKEKLSEMIKLCFTEICKEKQKEVLI